MWVPAHINPQTGQADQTIYTFKTLNLQVSAIEKVEVYNSQGVLTVAANNDVASATEAGGINNTTPGYPSAEIVATIRAESISMMWAIKVPPKLSLSSCLFCRLFWYDESIRKISAPGGTFGYNAPGS